MPDSRRTGLRVACSVLAILAFVDIGHGHISAPAADAGQPSRVETVVLISIDGLRSDDPERAGATHLGRLRREGASAAGLIPPFPTNTFPAHATIATGVYPDRHGIINNSFLDRSRGIVRKEDDASWLLAEPLWVTAERQGLRAAIFHWVSSYTPWRGVAASYREPYSGRVRDSTKVSRIITWLGLNAEDRPRLILSYLRGVDAVAHREGPDSDAVRESTLRVDKQVGRLLDAMENLNRPATLIVVSDHGMAGVTRVHRMDRILEGADGMARAISSGATSNIYCGGRPACDRAERLLRAIDGMEVFRRDDLPPSLHYRLSSRTGDLVAIAPPGSYFSDGPGRRPAAVGMHGYRPENPEMRGVFYIWGSGVRAGARRESVRAVDIAPLVCRLLGMRCPDGIDGSVPEDLLEGVSPGHPGEAHRGPEEMGSD